MRLTGKLVLVFVAVVVLVLSGSGWLQFHQGAELFDRDMRRDAAFAVRILAHDVEVTWQHRGRKAALEILRDPVLTTRHFDATWIDQLADAPPGVREMVPGDVRSIRTASSMETWTAVRVRGGEMGAVRLREPLTEQRQYVAATIRRTALTTALLAAACAVATAVLSSFFVGRPTRRMVAKARRIGAGDLGGRLDLRQRDELGEIAREIDAMCERLAEARAGLEAETERRIAAVEALRHADRLMTVGLLASGIAHELGTPINVVAGRAQMIATGEVEGAEVTDSARVIVEQSARMTAIIRQLLDFARKSGGERRRQDVAATVVRATDLLSAMARKAGVGLTVDAAAVEATIDDGQIEQVVTNLVVNAIHATPSGGKVAVDVSTAVAQGPDGWPRRCARIRVHDSGHGMDDTTRARIFEPFFTTKQVGDGTGLGLSVSWGIVREHGGWIDVKSAPGQGSTFSVWLPT